MPVFKTGAFNRSATSPRTANAIIGCDSRRFEDVDSTTVRVVRNWIQLPRFDPDVKVFIIAQISKTCNRKELLVGDAKIIVPIFIGAAVLLIGARSISWETDHSPVGKCVGECYEAYKVEDAKRREAEAASRCEPRGLG